MGEQILEKAKRWRNERYRYFTTKESKMNTPQFTDQEILDLLTWSLSSDGEDDVAVYLYGNGTITTSIDNDIYAIESFRRFLESIWNPLLTEQELRFRIYHDWWAECDMESRIFSVTHMKEDNERIKSTVDSLFTFMGTLAT